MTTIHAGAVLIGERGVLIRGPSGSGKSAFILALLAANPERTALVADDRVHLSVANGRLIATAPSEIAGLLEVRGQGISHLPYVSPVVIDLVVDLTPPEQCPRLPSAAEEVAGIDGVNLPRLILPIGASDGALRVATRLAPKTY